MLDQAFTIECPLEKPIIRRATADDLMAFYGRPVRPSCKAWVAIWKGEIACVAGIAIEPYGMVAFSDVKPVDAPPITIWRTAKAMLEEMRGKGLPLIVHANRRRDKSGKFLKSLGFMLLREEEDGNLLYGLKK